MNFLGGESSLRNFDFVPRGGQSGDNETPGRVAFHGARDGQLLVGNDDGRIGKGQTLLVLDLAVNRGRNLRQRRSRGQECEQENRSNREHPRPSGPRADIKSIPVTFDHNFLLRISNSSMCKSVIATSKYFLPI